MIRHEELNYFVLSIEILDKSKKNEVMERIFEAIEDLEWSTPLSNYFLVNCESEDRRVFISQILAEFCSENKNVLRFMLTPIINNKGLIATTRNLIWKRGPPENPRMIK